MTTYNPILRKEELQKNIIFQSMPVAEPGTAIVLSKETMNINNSLTNVDTNRSTLSELRWGGYKASYKVDISSHNIDFDCELCCKNPIFKFLLTVKMTCRVIDPKLIIEKKINDVTFYLKPIFESEIQEISKSFEIEQWLELRDRINDLVRSLSKKIDYFELGDFYCELSINQEAKELIEKRLKLEQENEIEVKRLRQQKVLEDERIKIEFEQLQMSEQFNLERLKQEKKLEEERLKMELEQLRNSEQYNLERIRQEQRLELEKGLLDKIKFDSLAKLIHGNDMNLLLIDMVKGNEKGKQTILDKYAIEQNKRAEFLQYLSYAIKEKILEPHNIRPYAMNLLNNITSNLGISPEEKTGKSSDNSNSIEHDNGKDLLEILSKYESDTKK